MKPDRTNYEIWLIDYLDGTLDIGRQKELSLFLNENPDIREELSDMISYRIAPTDHRYIDKHSLKKSAEDLSESQFEMMCIAASENDLTENQISELEEIIASSQEKRKIAEKINRLKLAPPKAEFRYKSKLRKLSIQHKVFRYSVISIGIAAAALTLFTILRSPVAPVPGNRILVTSQDTILKENIFVEQTDKTILKQPGLISENVIPEAVKKEEDIPGVIRTDSRVAPVSMGIDTASSPAFVHSNEISKIDYHSSVSLNTSEINQSLVAINLITVPDVPDDQRPGLNASVAKFFREKILKSKTPEKGSLKGYEIADAGINGLNRLFGWQMSLEKKTDEKGEVSSVYFNSRLLKFNAPVKKSEPLE